MQLTFVGADHEVTGSCHCLKVRDKNILVDCGMEQGRDIYVNEPLPVKPADVDYVFITHAHIDHSGMLPWLYAQGFRGQILSTKATAQLCDIMLRDSAHIQEQETSYRNKKGNREEGAKEHTEKKYEPIYTMADAMAVVKLFVPYEYDRIYTLCEGVKFRFTDIGHLLGSASIELWLNEDGQDRKIVFSGDIGNKNQALLNDPKPTEEADYVLIESTYGDRLHEESDIDPVERLAEIIDSTFHRGGNVVIPAFAVGRTQVMLYYIKQIKDNNMVPDFPDFPVYVDSPLAVEATSIFEDNDRDCFDAEAQALLDKGIDPINFRNLHLSITTDESRAINEDMEPKVIISASGMCDAGRIKHHLKYNLWREDSSIVFVGYQAEGSLGRRLEDGADEVKIFGQPIHVSAHIEIMPGMSGHADKAGLLEWIGGFKIKPKQVFVVHGDPESAEAFTTCLREEHGYNAMAPYSGTSYDLLKGEFIRIAKPVLIKKKTADGHILSDSFTKLRIAQKRLDKVIMASTGLPNKDLDKFTKEINDLCRKYQISDK